MKRAILVLLLFAMTLLSQEKTPVAVMELNPESVPPAEARLISSRLRTSLFESQKFTVVEREKMDEILNEQGFQLTGCTSNECVVEAGKLLGVKQIFAGYIGKIGSLYSISIRLIDIESGTIINTATVDCSCPIEVVYTQSVDEVVNKLISNEENGSKKSTLSTAAGAADLSTPINEYGDASTSPEISYVLSMIERGKRLEAEQELSRLKNNNQNRPLAEEAYAQYILNGFSEEFLEDLDYFKEQHPVSSYLPEIEMQGFSYAASLANSPQGKETAREIVSTLRASRNEAIREEAMAQNILLGFSNNLIEDIERFKAYYPNSPHIKDFDYSGVGYAKLLDKTGKREEAKDVLQKMKNGSNRALQEEAGAEYILLGFSSNYILDCKLFKNQFPQSVYLSDLEKYLYDRQMLFLGSAKKGSNSKSGIRAKERFLEIYKAFQQLFPKSQYLSELQDQAFLLKEPVLSVPILYDAKVFENSKFKYETKLSSDGKRLRRGLNLVFSYAKDGYSEEKVKISPVSSKENLFTAINEDKLKENVYISLNMEYIWEIDIFLYGGFEGKFISNQEKSTRIKRALLFSTPPYSKKLMNVKYFVLTFDLDDQLNMSNPQIIPHFE